MSKNDFRRLQIKIQTNIKNIFSLEPKKASDLLSPAECNIWAENISSLLTHIVYHIKKFERLIKNAKKENYAADKWSDTLFSLSPSDPAGCLEDIKQTICEVLKDYVELDYVLYSTQLKEFVLDKKNYLNLRGKDKSYIIDTKNVSVIQKSLQTHKKLDSATIKSFVSSIRKLTFLFREFMTQITILSTTTLIERIAWSLRKLNETIILILWEIYEFEPIMFTIQASITNAE
ncbi:MAG: hypothetical protein HY811_06475 [Planctomycetes bacterium]|nr:hypothetical protein [Planctomycetota bacterium]